MSGLVQPSLAPSTLAIMYTSKIAADDCVSKFLDKLEQVKDVCGHSVCQALHISWQSIISRCAVPSKLGSTFLNSFEEGTTSHHLADFESKLWAQIALDFTWSKLNNGYWKDVNLVWREVYATAALFKGIILLNAGRMQEALSEIDRGILLGALMFCDDLKSFACTLTHEIQKIKQSSSSAAYRNESASSFQHQFVPCSIKERDKSGIGKVVFRNYTCYRKSCKTSIRDGDSCSSLSNNLLITPLIDKTRRIAVVNCPSLEVFYQKYMMSSTSVVISGAMDLWPAYGTRKWSIEYLRQIAGPRTVPVELGSHYTDSNWTQKLMTFSKFIDTYITINDKNGGSRGYLAQHQLFDQIPELKEDIVIPEYCYLMSDWKLAMDMNSENHVSSEFDDQVKINAWFGPSGTVSPLHYDPDHNLLSQVVGRKYIRVYDKEQSPYIYPQEGLFNNTSQVHCEDPDLEKFPLFCRAVYSEFIIHPGQMLYIPPKHWHYVRALDISFSVSFWWN